MTTEGLIGYQALIEHHKEHHKVEDALTAERDNLKEKLDRTKCSLHSIIFLLPSKEITEAILEIIKGLEE